MKAKEGEVEIYINPGNHISGRTEYLPVWLNVCVNVSLRPQATTES